VIESPLAAAASTTELLLTSWGGVIRVLPGVPASWPDVVFHKLLAEGAFEISARRAGGATVFVRVHDVNATASSNKSRRGGGSGRSCVLLLPDDMSSDLSQVQADPSSVMLAANPDGTLRVSLPIGVASVVLTRRNLGGGGDRDMTIAPLPGVAAEYNYWGTRPF
jgi:hypothetical protein